MANGTQSGCKNHVPTPIHSLDVRAVMPLESSHFSQNGRNLGITTPLLSETGHGPLEQEIVLHWSEEKIRSRRPRQFPLQV